MSEDQQMGGAQPNDAVSGGQGGESQHAVGGGDEQRDASISAGEKRLLGEVRSLKKKLEEKTALASALEMQKLDAEGDKDKKIEFLQTRVNALEGTLKEKDQKIAYNTLGSQVKTQAAQMGCERPEDLLSFMNLSDIPVDPDTYQADADSIRILLEEQKKTRPFYFTKPAPSIQDVSGSNSVHQQPEVDLKSKSREELLEMARKMGSEKF